MADHPLRILVFANLPPHVLGGAENQVSRLVEEWVAAGHHVEVAGHRIPDGVQDLGRARVNTHHVKAAGGGRFTRAARYFTWVAGFLRRRGPDFDIIYCRGLADAALSVCLLKAVGLTRLPLLACPINAKGAGDASFIQGIPGSRIWIRLIDRQCNAINLIASAIGDDMRALGLRHPRLACIPNGIPIEPALPRLAAARPRRLLWTGRLSDQKGLDLLMPALAEVSGSPGCDFCLEIVGAGPNLPALEQLCEELGLKDRVSFLGSVPKHEVRALLARSDVFVLPSRYEGMSNSALEAMEAGLPVLATRCGGIDEHVLDADAGWLCEPGSVPELRRALLEMFAAPSQELLLRGARARLRVERDFEIGAVAARNLDLMSAIVGRALPP